MHRKRIIFVQDSLRTTQEYREYFKEDETEYRQKEPFSASGVGSLMHNKTVSSAPILSLASGCVVMLAGLIFARPLLELLGTKPELISGAELYLRIYFCGMPALSMYNYGNAVLSAMGETKKPLIFLTIAGIINVILNLFFVIVCSLDVAGVAVASVISQYISAALVLIYLLRSQGFYRIEISKKDLSKKNLRELTVLGLPTGVQNAIFQIANLFVQGGVNTFDTAVVSGVAAAQNADALVYNPMQAYYTACSTFIGQNYGAMNKKESAKVTLSVCCTLSDSDLCWVSEFYLPEKAFWEYLRQATPWRTRECSG